MRCSELRATNCSRPFVFASTRLPICWNTVQAPVPRRQSQSAECLLGLSFLLSFLPPFLLSHFFPQSSCEEERVVYLSRVRVPTVALPPRFPHSSLPNSSVQPIHRLEIQRPSSLEPSIHLSPLSSAPSLPSHQLARFSHMPMH